MKLKEIHLDDLLIASGRDRARDNILPILSITMKSGLVDQSEKFKKRIASSNTSNYKIVYENELVVGFPIDEGVIDFQTKYKRAIVSPAYSIWKLRKSRNVHIPYLKRILRAPETINKYKSKMQGAVARRRSIKSADFLKIRIPLPPLEDQKRIASLLTRTEKLIARRKESIQLLDELLKSTFLEMFGDPVRNEKGWEKNNLGNLLSEIESGKSPKCEPVPAKENEWGVLKLSAVTECTYNQYENKTLPKDIKANIKYEINKGDVLFSRKNTYDLVAACAYVFETSPKLLMSDLIFRLVVKNKNKLNPIFLWKLLISETQRRSIQKMAGGAAGSMPNISKTNLKTANIIIPPIELQNQFSTIVKKVESIKSRYQQSLTELENLYGCLSQKAFKGDLDLSRIPLPQKDESEEKKTKTVQIQAFQAKDEPEQKEKKSMNETELSNKIRKMFKDKLFNTEDLIESLGLAYEHSEDDPVFLIDKNGKNLTLKDFLFAAINSDSKEHLSLEQIFTDDPHNKKLEKRVFLKVKS